MRVTVLFFAAAVIFLSTISVVTFACAQTDSTDVVTITMYYPSPYGAFRDLEIRRSVKYKPLPDLSSSTIPGPAAGQLAYVKNATVEGFRYYNGTQWLALAGGATAGTVIVRSCPWASDATTGADKGWGNQCNMATDNCCKPADCPTGWTDIGKEAIATDITCPGSDVPPSGLQAWDRCAWDSNNASYNGAPAHYIHPVTVGQVVRYCVKE
ncbi:MAG: hypothetical protein PHT59_05555 [Candidatus Omnitrophica bacterium]|nr:hypothetical protein [Candidatus Omnitrophota bacterium]